MKKRTFQCLEFFSSGHYTTTVEARVYHTSCMGIYFYRSSFMSVSVAINCSVYVCKFGFWEADLYEFLRIVLETLSHISHLKSSN